MTYIIDSEYMFFKTGTRINAAGLQTPRSQQTSRRSVKEPKRIQTALIIAEGHFPYQVDEMAERKELDLHELIAMHPYGYIANLVREAIEPAESAIATVHCAEGNPSQFCPFERSLDTSDS